jgi:hypothetical protein
MPEEPPSPQEEERGDSDLLDELFSRLPIAEGGWIDLLSAVLLSVTVVASALSAWQASLWSGEQATLFAEASTARITSNRETAIALTQISYDAATFVDATAAFTEGNQEVLDLFNERLFRDDFKLLIDDWVALDPLNNPDAPKTPFELEGAIDLYMAESMRFEDIASEKFNEGKEANQNNDNWILATVLFASVLFFAGISTKFKSAKIRALSIVIATIALVASIALVTTLPRLIEV